MAKPTLTTDPDASTGAAPQSIAAPVVPHEASWHPLPIADVTLSAGFWADRQRLNHEVTLPHIQHWLEHLGWIKNFDYAVTGELPQKRQGREFSDSETYKLLEGLAWEIGRTGDPELERDFRQITARVAAAQEPDGYLNTMFGRPGQAPRYSDLEWGHELYCYGHLIQAGVARARTYGDDELVQVALAAADHVCEEFSAETDTRSCGHAEIETALVELYRLTGQEKYLRQAQLFLERRGEGHLGEIDFGPAYFQDDLPIREARVLRGHAVRALYLSSGAVDLAVETDDEHLLRAVQEQTLTTLARRTYITGGMGAHHEGESFGQDFELPADRSYSESCAGVASIQLNHRLTMSTADVRHADAVERTLYNIVATAVGSDGCSFFYTNTLHQREQGEAVEADSASPRAAGSSRAPWYNVSCCPTNLTRTLASLGSYMVTRSTTGLQLHQFFEGTVDTALVNGEHVALRIETQYPYHSRITITVVDAPKNDWTLDLRVPAWAHGASVHVSGQPSSAAEPGYLRVPGQLHSGDTVELDLPLTPRWTTADPRVDAVRGQLAVERGPLVMALESPDLRESGIEADISTVRVHAERPLIDDEKGVRVAVSVMQNTDLDWPYATAETSVPLTGSSRAATGDSEVYVPLIPYHQWANRGPSTMRVWLPEAKTTERGGALYDR